MLFLYFFILRVFVVFVFNDVYEMNGITKCVQIEYLATDYISEAVFLSIPFVFSSYLLTIFVKTL